MIGPEYFEDIQNNNVVVMYSELSQELTQSIIKQLQETGDITSFTKSQISVLQQIGGNKILLEALYKTNKLSGKRKKELKIIFEDLAKESMQDYKEQFERVEEEYKISPEQYTLINTALKRTNKEFSNLTKTIAYATKKQYVEALDYLYTQVATGAFDYDKAIKRTVTDLSEKGITLKDSAGRNIRLEGQVRNNLFTSLTQTANDISKGIGDKIDANCVYIGHSPFCRPTHRVIDGVYMSIDKFKEYKHLTEEPNCHHVVNYDWQSKFDNKKDKILYTDGHLTEAQYNKNYETRQNQNYLARQVRYKKEEIQNIKGTGNTDLMDKKKQELKLAQSKYRSFCKANGLEVDYSQTWKARI